MSQQKGAGHSDPGAVPRHICHCGKSFIRKEHLNRHQATHDGPAFVCDKCQRQFSRKDLHRRHVLLHDTRNPRTAISCDACRANKTKCSGSPLCSFCKRRGIRCTFKGGPRGLQRSMARDGAAPANASSDQVENDVSSLHVGLAHGSTLSDVPSSSEKRTLSANLDFLRSLTVLQRQREPGTFEPMDAGMGAIHEALIAGHPSLKKVMQLSRESSERVHACSRAYLEDFHIRWPVLHAPTFNVEHDPLPLTAAVCMIGTWFRAPTISIDRFYALRVHEFLVQRFLQDIVDSTLLSTEKKWPVDFWRAVLLTLAFSLYRTDEMVISKTMLLRSLFITHIKQLGLFDSMAIAKHQQKHFPGTYPLYLLQAREGFKKIAVLMFQLDAYLALAHGQSPMLHRQDLDVALTPSFGSWNAFGIDVCHKRLSEEPAGRAAFKISEMTKSPDTFGASPLLLEDIQLGLCGLIQTVWVSGESLPWKSNGYLGLYSRKLLLIDKLDSWKAELDRSSDLISTKNVMNGAADYLLLAYRGEDDSATSALKRITALIQDSTVLYYFLKLCACSGLRICNKDVLDEQIDGTQARSYKSSYYGQEVLVCALDMIKTVEAFDTSAACVNPLIRHALRVGAQLTRELISEQICDCRTKEGQVGTDMVPPRRIENGRYLVVDGERVCVCDLETWMARFEKAVENQKTMTE
ncbi:hypothetical protein BX600DRAFT_547793 [Xylariales sp. PMI_506]|nr:hypothetical protein BX600DRAFT_547793 [Xylariales sp. PMI_506]